MSNDNDSYKNDNIYIYYTISSNVYISLDNNMKNAHTTKRNFQIA